MPKYALDPDLWYSGGRVTVHSWAPPCRNGLMCDGMRKGLDKGLPEAMLVGRGRGPFMVGMTWGGGGDKRRATVIPALTLPRAPPPTPAHTHHGRLGAGLVQQVVQVVPDDVAVKVLAGLHAARLAGSAPVDERGHGERGRRGPGRRLVAPRRLRGGPGGHDAVGGWELVHYCFV